MKETKNYTWRLVGMVGILALVVTAGCCMGKGADELIFVNVPGGGAGEDQEKFQPILDYVAEVAGISIRYMTVTDYAACIQAMQFGHADMARLGPFQYVQARELTRAFPIARDIKSNTGEPFYYTLILARADCGFENITVTADDLKWLSVAFVSPTSTSGYMVPKTMLAELGMTDADFGDIYFAGSHASSITALANGMVDIACTNEFRYLKAIEAGVIVPEDVTIIMRSDPIPTDPIVLRQGLGEELVARLMAAWLTVPPEACEAFKLDGFAIAMDEDYDPIRAIADTLDLNP